MESYLEQHMFTPETGVYDVREDFLRRTIEVKNKNIDELLKELKETQELYQTYKSSYLAEQQKLKSKVSQLTEALSVQSNELDRQKQLSMRLKGELQAFLDREQKMIENHMIQSKQQHNQRKELQDKCRELMRENNDLKHKNQGLSNRYIAMQERCLQNQRSAAAYRDQLRNVRNIMEEDKLRWLQQKKQLMDRLQQQQLRKQDKQKVNRKLDALEQKIIQTMRKI